MAGIFARTYRWALPRVALLPALRPAATVGARGRHRLQWCHLSPSVCTPSRLKIDLKCCIAVSVESHRQSSKFEFQVRLSGCAAAAQRKGRISARVASYRISRPRLIVISNCTVFSLEVRTFKLAWRICFTDLVCLPR